MSPGQRRGVIVVALAATVIAAAFAPAPEEEIAAATHRVPSGTAGLRASAEPATARAILEDRALRDDTPPVFERRSWSRPPTTPTAAQKVAVAVPLETVGPPTPPFRVLGRFVEDGVPGLFVQTNETMLVVRAGDSIGENYRLESIADQSVIVLYLPLNVMQTIASGAAN